MRKIFRDFEIDRSHAENDSAELFICASGSGGALFRRMRPDLDIHARLPALSVTAVCAIAAIALAVAMGIGRFAFTPLLPLMVRDGSLAQSAGAWLAASNYLGYLAGALTASRLGLSLPTLMRVSLAGIVVDHRRHGRRSTDWQRGWFCASSRACSAPGRWSPTSAWALQHLAQAGRTDLSGMVYAGVGLGHCVCRAVLPRGRATRRAGQPALAGARGAGGARVVVPRLLSAGRRRPRPLASGPTPADRRACARTPGS